jgi:cytochrome c553
MRTVPVVLKATSVVMAILGLSACDNMQHQQNARAFTPSRDFADDSSARTPPAHTVARSDRLPDDPTASGLHDGRPLEAFPMKHTRAFVLRGGDRYGIFCADCHGSDGDGRGIVVARGFPKPDSFFDARVEKALPGAIYLQISNGSGVMYGFADRLSPSDRWAIVAYIRALEKTRSATLSEVPESERGGLTDR